MMHWTVHKPRPRFSAAPFYKSRRIFHEVLEYSCIPKVYVRLLVLLPVERSPRGTSLSLSHPMQKPGFAPSLNDELTFSLPAIRNHSHVSSQTLLFSTVCTFQ